MRALVAASAVLAATLTAGCATAAPDTRPARAYEACMRKAANTQAMVACAAAERAVQDKRLNAAYERALAKLNRTQKARLRAAQRAWIAFRDADCAARIDAAWGTMSRVDGSVCLIERSVERTRQLEDFPPHVAAR